jgi:hypothetical protein
LKHFLFRAISIAAGIAVTLLALEIVLRFLPVNEGARAMPVNEAMPVPHFEPSRHFVWSKEWDFQIVNHVKTNNYGFINDQDYDPSVPTPLLAVIGDSFVEALMVPYRETLSGRLASHAGSSRRVYSFGASSAPLSTYLAFAQYAKAHFHPTALVVVVVGNDFDESLFKYKTEPGHHYFVRQPDGEMVLRRLDYVPTISREIARRSALFRYLALNTGTLARMNQWRYAALTPASPSEGESQLSRYVGNTLATVEDERVTDSKQAVDAFLEQLPAMAGVPPGRILFVVDGIRPYVYRLDIQPPAGSYFELMRRYFAGQARKAGYEVIDLHPLFAEHFQKHGRPFEYPTDGHWNSLGHQVSFEAVVRSSVYTKFMAQSGLPQQEAPVGGLAANSVVPSS